MFSFRVVRRSSLLARGLSALASTACLLLAAPTQAQNTIHVPADRPTIQAGINAAKTGDTVLVAPGTYYENIDFLGKAITVTSSGGAASTIIDGGGKGVTVTFKSQEPRAAILSNFTITHGGYDNPANYLYAGSGVSISDSTPTVLNNNITQNYCQNISISSAGPLIQGNVVSSSLIPADCFVLNTGGIHVSGDYTSGSQTVPALIIGNTIQNNTTGQSGDGGGDGGAGIAIWGGSPVIQNNIIRNNVTLSGSGAAINVVYGTGISIIQNLIYGNSSGCGGGAIGSQEGGLSGDIYLLIANNTVVDDTGGTGGGYSDCRKTSEIWTAFYEGGGPTIKFVNNIFEANSAPALDCGSLNGSSVGPIDEAHQSLFDHNLLYNTAGSFFATDCVDTSHLHGNLVADPQFVNAAGNDFHLRSGSPAIDAGNGSVLAMLQTLSGISLAKDFDGNSREQDATGKGLPVIDMGAYEVSGTVDASPTRVVLSSSAYTAAAGSPITLTATLSSALGVPTGSTRFFIDNQQVGTSVINAGVASLSNVVLTPGVHALYAGYDGQGSSQPAISVVVILDISKYVTLITLTNSPNPSASGKPVQFSVHASSTDTTYVPSPVQLNDASTNTPLATLTPDASGNASFTISTLAVGLHYIDASYAGDSIHASAATDVAQQVTNPYTTTTTLAGTPNPSILNNPVSMTALVTSSGGGVPTGAVAFYYGTTSLGTATVAASATNAGTATISVSTLPVGYDLITATFEPTGSFVSSSGTYYQQVLNGYATTTSLTASPNPSNVGQSVTFSASVIAQNTAYGTPTGSITFNEGVNVLGTTALSAAGSATLSTSALARGPHTITATYFPAGSFAASSYSVTQTVNGLPTTSTLNIAPSSVTYGTPITLSATVTPTSTTTTGTPTGTVTFYADGASAGTVTLSGPTASLVLTPPGGAHSYACTYSGDGTFNNSNCAAVPLVVSPAASSLALTSSANPSPALSSVTFTARLTSSGAPLAGATVTFTIDGATATAVASASGLATVTVTLAAGAHAVSATYAGDASHAASSGSLPQTAVPNPTTTAVIAAPNPAPQNQPITIVASLHATTGTAQPYGTVVLSDGGAPIGTMTIATGLSAASVTFTISTLTVGAHTLTATYTPADANFIASTSASVSVIITPADAVLGTGNPSLTIQTEHHSAIAVNLTSVGGLTGSFTLSCGSLPQWAHCYFGQTTLNLPANGTANTTLEIDTDAVYNFKASLDSSVPFHPGAPGPGTPASAFARGGGHPASRPRGPGRLPLLALSPLALFAFAGRRRKLKAPYSQLLRLGLPLLLAALGLALSGCGDQYPNHTEPGSYTVQITATSLPGTTPVAMTRNATFTLVVTP